MDGPTRPAAWRSLMMSPGTAAAIESAGSGGGGGGGGLGVQAVTLRRVAAASTCETQSCHTGRSHARRSVPAEAGQRLWFEFGLRLCQPQGNVKRTPSPSGGALCMAAPNKRHGGNNATRSLCV